MRNCKSSRYNLFFDAPDGALLAYNTHKGSLARISRPAHALLKSLEDSNATIAYRTDLDSLIAGGYLVEESMSELGEMVAAAKTVRTSRSALNLTIAPTLSCNFRCGYCFQEHPKSFMSLEVQDGLVKMIESQAPDLSALWVTWFGGEPLLAPDAISHLSAAFIEMSDRWPMQYDNSAIITNGYHLNEKNCRILRDARVSFVQVTLDGVGEAHDVRRPLAGGQATFARIVDGLHNVTSILPDATIVVRVNTDSSNTDAASNVQDFLESLGLGNRIGITVGHVQGYTACSKSAAPLTQDKLVQIQRRASKRQNVAQGVPPGMPARRALSYCQANQENAYVVSPTGALFKCWIELDVDEQRAVGHVLRPEAQTTASSVVVRRSYADWLFLDDPECASCKVAPICGGGCGWMGMVHENDYSRPRKVCSPFKFGSTLEDKILSHYFATIAGTPMQTGAQIVPSNAEMLQ